MVHKTGHIGNIIVIAIIVAVGIGVWANSGTLIPNGDDFCFAFRIVSDSEVTDTLHRQPLNNIDDILDGQKIHYAESHGRIPLIILSQFFEGFWDFSIYRVVNAVIFCMTALLICRMTIPGNPLAAVLTTAGILFLMPEAGFLYNSPIFSINYLWALFINLCAIIVWKKKLWLLSPLMFIAGWSHEAFAIPIAGAMTMTLLHDIRTLRQGKNSGMTAGAYANVTSKDIRRQLVILLFYGAGVVIMVISPGNFLRFNNEGGETGELLLSILHRCYNMLSNGWVLLFLTWICSFRFIRKPEYKSRLKTFCRNNTFILSAIIFSIIFLFIVGSFKGRSSYALSAFSMILYLRFFRNRINSLNSPKYYIPLVVLVLSLQWSVIGINAEQRRAYDNIIVSYLDSPDGSVALTEMPHIPLWAAPWANTYNPEILPGDLFDALSRSTAADYYSHPCHSPLLTFSTEELNMLKHPDSLFIDRNRVPGTACFYTTPGMEHFVRKSDMREPSVSKGRYGFIHNSINYTSIYSEETGKQMNWKKRLKSSFSSLPMSGTLNVQTIIIGAHRYEIASKDSPYTIIAINR